MPLISEYMHKRFFFFQIEHSILWIILLLTKTIIDDFPIFKYSQDFMNTYEAIQTEHYKITITTNKTLVSIVLDYINNVIDRKITQSVTLL